MSWARLDDKFPRHPKVAGLSDRAFRVHVSAICYCAEYGTHGVVPSSAFGVIGATPPVRKQLIEFGLWENGDGEFRVHDFAEYNPRDPGAAERMKRHRQRTKGSDEGDFS